MGVGKMVEEHLLRRREKNPVCLNIPQTAGDRNASKGMILHEIHTTLACFEQRDLAERTEEATFLYFDPNKRCGASRQEPSLLKNIPLQAVEIAYHIGTGTILFHRLFILHPLPSACIVLPFLSFFLCTTDLSSFSPTKMSSTPVNHHESISNHHLLNSTQSAKSPSNPSANTTRKKEKISPQTDPRVLPSQWCLFFCTQQKSSSV